MLRGIARTVLSFALFGILMFRAISYGTVRGFRLPSRTGVYPHVTSSTRLLSTEIPEFGDGDQVSKHFTIPQEQLLTVLKKFRTDIREKPDGQYELKECKLCNKRNRDKPDNVWKLNVWPSGSYNCLRCSSGGSWYDLKQKACGSFMPDSEAPEVNVFAAKRKNPEADSPNSASGKASAPAKAKVSAPYVIPNQWGSNKPFDNLFPDEKRLKKATEDDRQRRLQVKSYLNSVRGLNDEVLRKYNVGFTMQEFLNDQNDWQGELCISFPWLMRREALRGKALNYTLPADAESEKENIIVRTKYRALSTKGLQRISPKGGMWGLFGWHTVPPSAPTDGSERAIILTEGEYDAMAAWQGLSVLPDDDPLKHIPVVSLPNGCNSLPTELIPLLDNFSKIYLWLDFDKSGQDACAKFVTKLGANRCAIVKPGEDQPNPPKDANDALRQGDPDLIPSMIRSAQVPSPEMFVTFADRRASVLQALECAEENEGSVATSLPGLTELCKGFRRGELVIFTGPTGSGKTTLLSQLGLDFAQQGRPTLWGSFEVKNERLMGKMMQQFHKTAKLNKLPKSKLYQVADDFEALPIKFLNFHGATNIDQIIAAMDHAVYRDDIQHIIIDNLQFMMPKTQRGSGGSGGGSGSSSSGGSGGISPGANPFYEKMEFQDTVVDKLRAFATEKNVNVILVIHPRKEEEGVRLSLSSVFGSAKATQEADLVLILQRFHEKAFLEVKKNRYDGVTGSVNIAFNAMNMCYEEVAAPYSKAAPVAARAASEPVSAEWTGTLSSEVSAEVGEGSVRSYAAEGKKYRKASPTKDEPNHSYGQSGSEDSPSYAAAGARAEAASAYERASDQEVASSVNHQYSGSSGSKEWTEGKPSYTPKYTKKSTSYGADGTSRVYKKSPPVPAQPAAPQQAVPTADAEVPTASKYAYTRAYKKTSPVYGGGEYKQSAPPAQASNDFRDTQADESAKTGEAPVAASEAPKYAYVKSSSAYGAYKRSSPSTGAVGADGTVSADQTINDAASVETPATSAYTYNKRPYTKKAASGYGSTSNSYPRTASPSSTYTQQSGSPVDGATSAEAAPQTAPKYAYTRSYKKTTPPTSQDDAPTWESSAPTTSETKYPRAPYKSYKRLYPRSDEESTAPVSAGDVAGAAHMEAPYAEPTFGDSAFTAAVSPAVPESAAEILQQGSTAAPRKYTRRSEAQPAYQAEEAATTAAPAYPSSSAAAAAAAAGAGEGPTLAAEAAAISSSLADADPQPAVPPAPVAAPTRSPRAKGTLSTKSASMSKKKLAAIARLEAAEKLEEIIKWPPRNAPTPAPSAEPTSPSSAQESQQG